MINGEFKRDAASAYLAEHWGLSYTAPTLANMARKGTGPIYRLRGRYAYYRQEDLDAWARPRIGGLKRRASDAGTEAQVA
jgi:hypothetical protein